MDIKQLKHWQDPANALIGVWICASPWVLGFADQSAAMATHLALGAVLIAVALGATFLPRAWEEWTEGAVGLALLLSPWVLGYAGMLAAMRNAAVSGVVVIALALWVLATDKDWGFANRRAAA